MNTIPSSRAVFSSSLIIFNHKFLIPNLFTLFYSVGTYIDSFNNQLSNIVGSATL